MTFAAPEPRAFENGVLGEAVDAFFVESIIDSVGIACLQIADLCAIFQGSRRLHGAFFQQTVFRDRP